MKDLFEEPLFRLLPIVRRYVEVIKCNDLLEITKLKQEHPQLFTVEFRHYLNEWLEAFGITKNFVATLRE
jgi:hypothetical protein